MQVNYIPNADDMLELELNSVLRDLEGFVLQAKSNPNKFTKHYYELISKISEAAFLLASEAANGEMV